MKNILCKLGFHNYRVVVSHTSTPLSIKDATTAIVNVYDYACCRCGDTLPLPPLEDSSDEYIDKEIKRLTNDN